MITAQTFRFTDDVPAMRSFLELFGLVPTVDTDRGWAVMSSASGDVLLHSVQGATESGATSGQTELCFEVPDLTPLAEKFDVTPVDEAWARSLSITDPLGDRVTINETQTDFYGYRTTDRRPDPQVSVTAVRFTDPTGSYGPFLAELGLRPAGPPDPAFALWAADAGFVGLHSPGEDVGQFVTGPAGVPLVHLTLGSSGDPAELEHTLAHAGHRARVDTTRGTMLEVIDPDGQKLQVHFTG